RARTAAGPMEALGLGIAWFGLGAAGIVSLSRLDILREIPSQIYANRYTPWPCLFWLGLALIGLGKSRAGDTAASRFVFAVALLLPLLGWPMQYGGRIYAALVRGHVDNTAVGSLVGVYPRNASLGETMSDEFLRGIPVLSPLHIAQFDRPTAALLGHPLPEN